MAKNSTATVLCLAFAKTPVWLFFAVMAGEEHAQSDWKLLLDAGDLEVPTIADERNANRAKTLTAASRWHPHHNQSVEIDGW